MVPSKLRIIVISRDLLPAAPGRRDITLFLTNWDAKISVSESRHERASNVYFGLALPAIICPINTL
jgi:hypothetical protein